MPKSIAENKSNLTPFPLLGHTQLKTTQRYAHLSQTTLLEAVEVAGEAAGLTVEALE